MKITNIFGTNQTIYSCKDKNYSNDLSNTIVNYGFEDFSREGISSYFSFRYPILELTMFEGYKKMDTGEIIDEEGEKHIYWRPNLENEEISFDEAMETVEELLINSVGKLIKNKKIIGITLSGGLDSSLLLAIVKKHFTDKQVFTYSCGFYGEDEFDYSRQVAKLFSDKHSETVLGKEDFVGENSMLKALIKQKASPLHPNELGLAVIEAQAKLDLCDIVLCGEGADDIFGGYGKNLRMYLNYDDKIPFYQYLMDNYRYFKKDKVQRLINSKYLVDDLDLVKSIFEEKECPEDIKNQMFYFIQRIHTRGLIDRGCNALKFNGFEAAFPFIDKKLVDFANSLDFDYKVHWHDRIDDSTVRHLSYKDVSEKYDTPKYILKKLAEKYLPYNIIYRPKYGFPVPFEQWFGDLKEYNLDLEVFNSNDISYLNGWEKFMVINLNSFVEIFKIYRNK